MKIEYIYLSLNVYIEEYIEESNVRKNVGIA